VAIYGLSTEVHTGKFPVDDPGSFPNIVSTIFGTIFRMSNPMAAGQTAVFPSQEGSSRIFESHAGRLECLNSHPEGSNVVCYAVEMLHSL
jgi:hypothetical protein